MALRIRDAAGTQVREITGNDLRDARGAGVNRVYWDMRHQPLTPLAGQPAGGGGGGGGFGGGGNNGPNVMPGDYRVTLVVDGKDIATKTVRVSGDKDMTMTDAERKTWHDTSLDLHDMQRVANTAAEAVNTLAAQLTAAESLLKTAANAPAPAKTALADANTKLTDLRRRLGLNQQGGGGGGGGFGGQQANVRGQLGQVKGQLIGSTSMPTAQQMRSSVELREDLNKVDRRYQRVDRGGAGDLRRARCVRREAVPPSNRSAPCRRHGRSRRLRGAVSKIPHGGKAMAIFGLFLIAIFWIGTTQRGYAELAEAQSSEFSKNANLALALDVQTNQLLTGIDHFLLLIKDQYEGAAPRVPVRRLVAPAFSSLSSITFIGVTDERGDVVESLQEFAPTNIIDREFFKTHQQTDTAQAADLVAGAGPRQRPLGDHPDQAHQQTRRQRSAASSRSRSSRAT